MIFKCPRCNRHIQLYAKNLCRSCYIYLHKNKEKRKASSRKWQKNNLEHINNYMKKYNKKPKVAKHIKEYRKEYNKLHREKNKESCRQWRLKRNGMRLKELKQKQEDLK